MNVVTSIVLQRLKSETVYWCLYAGLKSKKSAILGSIGGNYRDILRHFGTFSGHRDNYCTIFSLFSTLCGYLSAASLSSVTERSHARAGLVFFGATRSFRNHGGTVLNSNRELGIPRVGNHRVLMYVHLSNSGEKS